MINTGVNQGSAKIYQFPVGGRAALSGRRDTETRSEAVATPETSQTDCFDSWYHQAAIDEAKPARDH
jgi:hypothetical protein